MLELEPMGKLRIPQLSDKQLTASYTARTWRKRKKGAIQAYLTSPQTGRPLDMPTRVLSC